MRAGLISCALRNSPMLSHFVGGFSPVRTVCFREIMEAGHD